MTLQHLLAPSAWQNDGMSRAAELPGVAAGNTR